MEVRKFFEEDWSGPRLKTVEHECADLKQADAALDRLDGHKRTSLEFWVSDDAILTVGGDGQKFVVSATYDGDGEIYTLIDPKKSADDYDVVVAGGQLGSYSANQVVDKDVAKVAVSYFCQHGKVSPALHWLRG